MKYIIYTDGGARGNPGPAAAAFVIWYEEKVLYENGVYLGEKTNNEAEYAAVVASLRWLLKQPTFPQEITFYLDSQLVVGQLTGKWQAKKPQMAELRDTCLNLLNQLEVKWDCFYVPRAQNARADGLVNQTLDLALNL